MAKRHDEAASDPIAVLAHNVARRMSARADYQGVLEQRNSALVSVAEKSGERSKPYQHVKQKLDRDEQQLERISIVVRRPISRMNLNPWLLLLIGVVLALLEAPANKFLFDVALQSTGFASYGASAAVTAFLLILAHFAGRGIRQIWSDYRRKLIVSSLLTFIACVIVALFIVCVLTVARAAFANEAASIADIVGGMQGTVVSQGPLAAVLAALANTSALVLACINIGGIVVTMLLAFFAHDSDRDFDHAQSEVERGEKALAKIHLTYLKAREKLIKQYSTDLLGYVGNYNTANQRVVELKSLLGRPLDEDDRFVLTTIDTLSDALDEKDEPEAPAATAADFLPPEPTPSSPAPMGPAGADAARRDPSVHPISAYRRPAGNEES